MVGGFATDSRWPTGRQIVISTCHCCHQQFAQTETLSNFCPLCAGRIFYVGSCEHLDDNPIYMAPSEEDK